MSEPEHLSQAERARGQVPGYAQGKTLGSRLQARHEVKAEQGC
jgi:hypothetical protein